MYYSSFCELQTDVLLTKSSFLSSCQICKRQYVVWNSNSLRCLKCLLTHWQSCDYWIICRIFWGMLSINYTFKRLRKYLTKSIFLFSVIRYTKCLVDPTKVSLLCKTINTSFSSCLLIACMRDCRNFSFSIDLLNQFNSVNQQTFYFS